MRDHSRWRRGRRARGVHAAFLATAGRAVLATILVASRTPIPAAALSAARPLAAQEPPRSALSVRVGDAWHEWWRAERAPRRWARPLDQVAGAVEWRTVRAGVELGELRLAAGGAAGRIRAILVRLDPAAVRFALVGPVTGPGGAGRWAVQDAPADAVVAINAGQFDSRGPWGWIVRDGVELQPPGAGPLSTAFILDGAGTASLIATDDIPAVRQEGRPMDQAFQSYPTLLVDDGVVPAALRREDAGVDLRHRDCRLALGVLRDGRILIALTRFDGLGGVLAPLPFGPTTPEMAALMGALGAQRAVLLDGGISGQLLVRDEDGATHLWEGWRRVPLGLVAFPR